MSMEEGFDGVHLVAPALLEQSMHFRFVAKQFRLVSSTASGAALRHWGRASWYLEAGLL
jgi:hypothetical protein